MLSVTGLQELGERLTLTMLREAFAHFPSGVVAVCAVDDEGLVGMAASSFTWVSFDPPLVGFFADRASATWARLSQASRLGVSVLSEQQGQLARQLSSRSRDRFDGVAVDMETGTPLLGGATATFVCRLYSTTDAGDHRLVLLEVLAMDADGRSEPLIYHRSGFRELAGVTA